MIKKETNTDEISLRKKLMQIGNPIEEEILSVQLTTEEAVLYEIDLNDVMTESDLMVEREGIDE